MLRKFGAAALLLAFLATSACQGPTAALPPPETTLTDVREASYDAMDTLLSQCGDDDCGRLLVATLVDINDVGRTSMFGRQIAEFHASRLSQRDFVVIHATMRQDHMIVRGSGQFLLSRDIQNLAADYNAKLALVGTYGVVSNSVAVSMRLVSTVDDSTVAAVDYELPRCKAVVDMLSSHGFSSY
jgi:TolB-like protein